MAHRSSTRSQELSERAHNIWLIDEVVRNILTQFPPGSERTLAHCALVAQALCIPALDILWYKLDGLSPVLRLFSPQDEDAAISVSVLFDLCCIMG